MPGLAGRMSTVIKAKISKLLDRAEDPAETLDYSYQKQLELLQNVKKGLADVVTSKKRMQLQAKTLEQSVVKLDTQARQAVGAGREDLARAALERISEAATGVGEQMADVGLAMQRAVDKTEQMRARAQAVDELEKAGTFEDITQLGQGGDDDIDRQLKELTTAGAVDDELAKIKAEVGPGGTSPALESGEGASSE